jgi:hypothetical protein
MWKVKTKIVPIVIGTLGTIKKGLDQDLQLFPGYPWAIEPTEDHTIDHCTHHSQSAGVNHSDPVLRSGLTRRLQPNN